MNYVASSFAELPWRRSRVGAPDWTNVMTSANGETF